MFYCKFCGRECKNENSLRNHERLCKSNPEYDAHKFQCEFCGRYFNSSNGYTKHVRLCENNPNRDERYAPWIKGKTKNNSEIVAKMAIKLSEKVKNGEYIGAYGRKGTLNFACQESVRRKISASMMGNHNNDPSKTGRGKKGWYKGIFCSSSYELAYLIYCLDHNINIKRCDKVYDYEYRGKHYKYYPDFIVDGTIIEIKGFWTEQVDAKTASVTDMPIKVLYRKDLKEVFDYINSTYDKQVDKNIHELFEDMGS